MVPLGIWGDVTLIATGDVWIEDVGLRTNISEDLSLASVDVEVTLRNASTSEEKITLIVEAKQEEETVHYSKYDVVISHEKYITQKFTIRNPKLWQPNELGDQPLYKLRILVLEDESISDLKELSFGLRRVKAIPNIMSPSGALPYTIEVNNRKIFIKGWNWVPIDQLYGRVNAEKYKKLIKLAKEAHCNFLRVWGGGLMEREVFYDLCDTNGIMVWQEFPLSSSGIDNEPSSDPSYLKFLEETARAIVKKRRHHPSLVIWCGGNELMANDGKPLTDKHPTIAMLKKVVLELDPNRIFLPTSPSGPTSFVSLEKIGVMHDVHGDYVYRGVSEHYRLYNSIDPLFHSEFGVEGVACLESLKKFISDEYLWPPDKTNPVWRHHGDWWINFDKIQKLFGKIEDIKTFIFASQLIQYEGLRYIIEANRRRKFHCSGVLPWQFNEPWPNASCTSCVDYYCHPKAGYWAVKKAYEPIHISAKYDAIAFYGYSKFVSEVWVSNDLIETISVTFSAKILNSEGTVLHQTSGIATIEGNSSKKLIDFVWTFPKDFSDTFYLLLELRDVNGKLLSDNCYVFSALSEPIFQKLRELPEWAKKTMGIEKH
ncbi:MAG: beta-mannosidase [Thermoproteota archaeon]